MSGNNNQRLKICIIGAGRVGTTIASVLAERNLPDLTVDSISSRSDKSLKRARNILGDLAENIYFTKDSLEAAKRSNCILISTPDDSISGVCRFIFGENKLAGENYIVIHFSGSKSLEVLTDAKKTGASTASIHPIKSFASIKEAIKTISGTVFGLTYSNEKAKHAASRIIESLGGSVIKVEDKTKPLYHAAACVASNYLVSLINYALLIHKRIGIDTDKSIKGLMNLVEGTVENIKKMGTKKSLTGPIARGDIGTIKEHLKSFNRYFEQEEIALYRLMGVETSKIAYQNGWIEEKVYKNLKKLLKD